MKKKLAFLQNTSFTLFTYLKVQGWQCFKIFPECYLTSTIKNRSPYSQSYVLFMFVLLTVPVPVLITRTWSKWRTGLWTLDPGLWTPLFSPQLSQKTKRKFLSINSIFTSKKTTKINSSTSHGNNVLKSRLVFS